MHHSSRLALSVAGTFAFLFFAPQALGQDSAYDRSASYGEGPPETVEVIAPRYYNFDRDPYGRAQRISMSRRIQMSDADLRTPDGAHEFRARVRAAAYDICRTLAVDFPDGRDFGRDCYKDAVANASHQADAAIERARYEY